MTSEYTEEPYQILNSNVVVPKTNLLKKHNYLEVESFA